MNKSRFHPTRRGFIKGLIGSAAASAVIPQMYCSGNPDNFKNLASAAGNLSTEDPGSEFFWEAVKDCFSLRRDLVMMNAANLCPSPDIVRENVFHYTTDVDSDASFPNRGKFGELKEAARKGLADFLGADTDEIALTRNTSEGNNTVINGLSLGRGDEVVIWDQNHPTANIAWDVRAERYGYRVIRVNTPPEPKSKDELAASFTAAVNRRTKVIAFSHVSNVSGIALPAKEICRFAKERGILTLVDGAQTFGSKVVDLHDIGCDFYTGSSHKWFCGPKEVGVLYVKKDRIPDLYPTHVGVGWENALKNGAQKFDNLGQQDDSRIAAMAKALEFMNTLGINRIEKRVTKLADAVKTAVKSKLENTKLQTPEEHDLSGGVVIFTPDGVDLGTAMNRLYKEHNIGCAVMGGEFAGIRLSPHIYNTLEEVDIAVKAVLKL